MPQSQQPKSSTAASIAKALGSSAIIPAATLQGSELTIFSNLAITQTLMSELFVAFPLGTTTMAVQTIAADIINYCNNSSEKKLRDILIDATFATGIATGMTFAVEDPKSLIKAPTLFVMILMFANLKLVWDARAKLQSYEYNQNQLFLLEAPENIDALRIELKKELAQKSKQDLIALITHALDVLKNCILIMFLIRTGMIGEALDDATQHKEIPTDLIILAAVFAVMTAGRALFTLKDMAMMFYNVLASVGESCMKCCDKKSEVKIEELPDEEAGMRPVVAAEGSINSTGADAKDDTPYTSISDGPK